MDHSSQGGPGYISIQFFPSAATRSFSEINRAIYLASRKCDRADCRSFQLHAKSQKKFNRQKNRRLSMNRKAFPNPTRVLAAILLFSATGPARADDSTLKITGSVHAKTELFTYYADGAMQLLGNGGGDPTNNTLTSFEAFLNGKKQISSQTSVHFSLPVSSIPYPALRNDLVRAYGNWKSENKKWEIDLGRFGTPFSLEGDELARSAFANHGLLWGEIVPLPAATIFPSLVAPRGHTGLRVASEWIADFLRTEFIYAAPEPFSGSTSIEYGARTELKLSEQSKWTFGILHSLADIRESRQLLHAGGTFRLATTDLTTELIWASEKYPGLDREQNHGIAIRSTTPLGDTLGLGARVELIESEVLATAALSQKISDAFDIRYQMGGSFYSDTPEINSYELGISGSFRF